MGRTSKGKGKFTDDELIREFIKRAKDVDQHPEVSKVPPTLMRAQLSAERDHFYVEVPTMDTMSWQHLATLVRPLALLEGEPIYLPKVLDVYCKLNPAAREAASGLRRDFITAMKDPLVQVGTSPDVAEGAPAPDGKPRLLSVTSYVVPPKDPLNGFVDITTGRELAEIYINSQLFHANPDQARKFESFSVYMKGFAQTCAAVQVRGSAYFIRRALRILEQDERIKDLIPDLIAKDEGEALQGKEK